MKTDKDINIELGLADTGRLIINNGSISNISKNDMIISVSGTIMRDGDIIAEITDISIKSEECIIDGWYFSSYYNKFYPEYTCRDIYTPLVNYVLTPNNTLLLSDKYLERLVLSPDYCKPLPLDIGYDGCTIGDVLINLKIKGNGTVIKEYNFNQRLEPPMLAA